MYTYYGLKVCYLSTAQYGYILLRDKIFLNHWNQYPVAMTVSFTFIAIVDFLIAVKVTVQNV
jgi:hypothetical protein